MRKLIFAALCLALAGPAWAAKQSSYDTKSTPASADKVLITDSEASNAPKQVTLGAIAALSPSMPYPGAGVPLSTGSAWGTSYTVGTAANHLVQLNASAQLPSVSADLLTITDTGSYFITDTVGAALQELGGAPELLFGTEFTETAGTGTVTLTLDFPVTSETYGAGWAADTEGAQRDDIYAILHVGDTDDDGIADKLDLAAAGLVKTDASGVISTATAGTDYLAPTNLATGSTDNAVLRANGTGGSTAQASGVTIDDNDNVSTTGTLSGKMATVVNSDTASYNVTTAQARAGNLFLTTNTATTTYNLPAAEAGMTACFSMGQGNSQILRIDTDGTDYIVKSTRTRTGTAGDYYGATASATNKVCVAAYDATDWYVESEVGTWTEE